MSYFPDAKNFVINDGIFPNVQGNQNQFNCGSGPSQIIGRDNPMTMVNGSFHNGPNSSIRNEARGNIDVYGQGDRCDVRLGTMEPFGTERAQPRGSSAPPLPTGYNMGPNGGITNSAGGDIRVTGQGYNPHVRIGNTHPPQQPYPYPLEHDPMSPQQMVDNPGMPLQPPPPQYDWPGYPSHSFVYTMADGVPHHQHQYSGPSLHPTSGVNYGVGAQCTQANDIRPHIGVACPLPTIPRPPASALLSLLRPQDPDPVLQWTSARSAHATLFPAALTDPAPESVVAAHSTLVVLAVPPLATREGSYNGVPLSPPPSQMTLFQVNEVHHSTHPREDSKILLRARRLSVPSPPLIGVTNIESAAPQAVTQCCAPSHLNQHGFYNLPLQIPGNVLVGSKSTILEQELSQIHPKVTTNPQISKFRHCFSWLIKHFKKTK